MTTFHPLLHSRHVAAITAAGLTAAVLIGWPWALNRPSQGAAVIAATRAPAEARPVLRALPFTTAEVVNYFDEALSTHGARVGESTVYAGNITGGAVGKYRVTVTPAHGTLTVLFEGGGDFCMTLAREFFEAPFFTRDEAQHFFSLLDEAKIVPQALLKRFAVRFNLVEHRDGFHLTITFAPSPSLL